MLTRRCPLNRPARPSLTCRLALGLAAGVLGVASVAQAIQPGTWTHSTEADFEPGETRGTVVSNLGAVRLARAVTPRATTAEDDATSILYDVQRIDGVWYAAGGPTASLLRWEPDHGGAAEGDGDTAKGRADAGPAMDELEVLWTREGAQIFALDVYRGRLLAAVSEGERSWLGVWDGDDLQVLAPLPGPRYLWAVVVDGDVIDVATGPEGGLYRVNVDPDAAEGEPADRARVRRLLDAPQANLLCLIAGPDGSRLVGTDTDGIVYRVQVDAAAWEAAAEAELAAEAEAAPAGGAATDDVDDDESRGHAAAGVSVFALLDADEPEIGALLLSDGVVYAGTADAEQAKPGRLEAATATERGRPGVADEAATAPDGGGGDGDRPDMPDLPQQPPADPEPMPGPGAGGDGEADGDGPAPGAEGESDDAAGGSDAEPEAGDDDAAIARPVDLMRRVIRQRQAAAAAVAMQAGDAPGGEIERDAASPAVTPAQRDALRSVIRQRLLQARRAGRLIAPTRLGQPNQGAQASPRPAAAAASKSRASQAGNAVYRIDADGFVTELFRESVMVLDLLERDGRILVVTGNEGQVFEIDPVEGRVLKLADLEPQQVMAITPGDTGEVLLATANPAQLTTMAGRLAPEGVYDSPVLEADQVSLFGVLRAYGESPEGAQVEVSVRSGNTAEPNPLTWSTWSEPVVVDLPAGAIDPATLRVDAPPARRLQYRLTLKTGSEAAPRVDRVEITHVTPNLRPTITSISATPAKARPNEEASPTINLQWEASDPNEDALRYRLERRAADGPWLPIAEDLTEPKFAWDSRLAPDGRYRVRVIATDAPDNPEPMAMQAVRVSDPVLVDNTAPRLADEPKVTLSDPDDEGRINATLAFTVADEVSGVGDVKWVLDGGDDWRPALPEDMIFDSTRERVRITISDLSHGTRVVTLRLIDAAGSMRHESVTFTVGR